MSCSHCPVSIRSSLAFLGHRAIQQKAELGGSWKKNFFQRVWDRLHTNSDWGESNEADDADSSYSEGWKDTNEEVSDHDRDEVVGEDRGDQMNALIKAAAIWLTEQDGSKPSSKRHNEGTPGSLNSLEGSSIKRRKAV